MGASEGVPGKLCRSTDLHRRSEGNGQHVVKLTVLLEKERKKGGLRCWGKVPQRFQRCLGPRVGRLVSRCHYLAGK